MPRPRKCRRVCHFPMSQGFVPTGEDVRGPEIILTVDEYEVLRLMDREGLSQEECGRRMAVARTTVQQIYAQARKKLADMLVDSRPLRIAGGDYVLCDGTPGARQCQHCFREAFQTIQPKGDHMMRIAVTYENGSIFQHFGHTEQFKIYDVQEGTVRSTQVVDTNGSGHGALAGVLNALNVDALICGGIGGGAQAALEAAGIKLYAGVNGQADEAVQALLSGQLAFDPNAMCSHHEEHHHGEHHCGEHHGEHHCGEHHHCDGHHHGEH